MPEIEISFGAQTLVSRGISPSVRDARPSSVCISSRYETFPAAARDWKRYSHAAGGGSSGGSGERFREFPFLLMFDPPRHTRLRGLITLKDYVKSDKYPLASKDAQGRLRVGAAIGFFGDAWERAMLLVEDLPGRFTGDGSWRAKQPAPGRSVLPDR